MTGTKLRKTYNILIRLAIILLTFGFLYDQLFHQKDFQSIIDFFPKISQDKHFYFLLALVIILLPFNQALEIVKWKFLIDKLEKVSFWSATKAVLTGISVSMFMPNRVGDYLGRVFVLKKADRLQAILSTILGSLAQLLTTLLFGMVAVAIFLPMYWDMDDQFNVWMYSGVIIIVIASVAAMVFAFLSFSAFTEIIKRISGHSFKRVKKYAQVFSWYSSADLLKVLLLSMLRYLVFSLQFYLLLHAFQIQIAYPIALVLIAVIYFLMTIIPTIALSELGVRGSVSLVIFSLYLEPHQLWSEEVALGVVSASTLLWLINLALPALLGVIFVYSLRFFRNSNGNVD